MAFTINIQSSVFVLLRLHRINASHLQQIDNATRVLNTGNSLNSSQAQNSNISPCVRSRNK